MHFILMLNAFTKKQKQMILLKDNTVFSYNSVTRISNFQIICTHTYIHT